MVEINPYAALSSLGTSTSDRISIADNFDTFLSLLTTQLQNQSPLDPLDTNQFTQQLVQFSEVEQTVKQNENLEQLIQLSAANAITNVVGFLGGEITIAGDTAQLDATGASWTYNLATAADNATITVRNSEGVPVFTTSGPAPAGNSTFLWNGQTDTGGIAPNGEYTISVSAVDSSGTAIAASTQSSGVVDGINFNGSEPVLLIGNREVKLDELVSVKLPDSNTQQSTGT